MYFNTKAMLLQKLKEEQDARAELRNAFAGLQGSYEIVSLDRDRLKDDARAIAKDRDKAYNKVTELKQELEAEVEWRNRIATQKRVMRIHLGSYYERLKHLLNAAQLVKSKGTMGKAKYEMLQLEIEQTRDFLASKAKHNTPEQPTSVSEKGGTM
jgi:uncharacterized coiled-coil DUF342 family protein